MVFITSQHYDIDKTKDNSIFERIKEQHDDCFICYENEDREKNKPIKFGRQRKYLKRCYCDVSVHITCLDKWYQLNPSCPICRKSIVLHRDKSIRESINDIIYYIIKKASIFVVIRILFCIIGYYYSIKHHNNIIDMIQKLNYIEYIIPENTNQYTLNYIIRYNT